MINTLRLATLGVIGASAFTMSPESLVERVNAKRAGAIISRRRDGEPAFVELEEAITKHSERMSKSSSPINMETRDADTAAARESFFDQFGAELGVSKTQLKALRTNHRVAAGISNYFYDQYLEGFKVFAGEVIAVVGSNNEVLRAHGAPLDVSAIPAGATSNLIYSSVDSVRGIISAHFGEGATLKDNLVAETVWYRSDLLLKGETGSVSLVVHVSGSADRGNGVPVRFDAFVDAKTGVVVDFIDREDSFMSSATRKSKKNLRSEAAAAVNGLTDPAIGSLKITEWDDSTGAVLYQYPSTVYPTDAEGHSAIVYTYWVTNLMRSVSNQQYLTWAGGDHDLPITVNILDYFNAYFDGTGIYLGDGLAVDDVMAHEWGHGYTDTINGLVYRGQSGALNEAYSDIIGESADIVGDSSDKPMRSATQTCTDANWDFEVMGGTDTGNRWMMGEDIDGSPSTSTVNNCNKCALRDMYYPECFGGPSTTKSKNYYCGRSDNGGVHTNSGVINRLFAVLVDGGKQGTTTIKKIGHTKAIALFLGVAEAMSSSSQFADFAALTTSTCNAMIGTNIYTPDVVSGASVAVKGLNKVDCQNVQVALKALSVSAKVC